MPNTCPIPNFLSNSEIVALIWSSCLGRDVYLGPINFATASQSSTITSKTVHTAVLNMKIKIKFQTSLILLIVINQRRIWAVTRLIYWSYFASGFIEARRNGLQLYLDTLLKHELISERYGSISFLEPAYRMSERSWHIMTRAWAIILLFFPV